MSSYSAQLLLETSTVSIRDVVCDGGCRHKSTEECAQLTHVVFPYRGVYVRHVGRHDVVAEANQVLFFNADESYRISHPVQDGDACLSLSIGEQLLAELAPKEHLRDGPRVAFRLQRLRIDARAQALVAMLRYSLSRKVAETLEGETLTLTLLRHWASAPRMRRGRARVARNSSIAPSSFCFQIWRDAGPWPRSLPKWAARRCT
jgi:hypothetical protein